MTIQSLVAIQGDHLGTNTRIVSEYFGRNHKDLLRSLRSLLPDCEEEFGRRNFSHTSYKDVQGKEQVMYNLTRDGFMLLSMSITGSRSMKLKIAFIEEFNHMESELMSGAHQANDALRDELLIARPLWQQINRYHEMGLNGAEIARLTSCGQTTIRSHRARMRAVGFCKPVDLGAMRKIDLPMLEELR